MGEPRQLRELAQYWAELKKRVERLPSSGRNKSFRTEVDGVLLQGVVSKCSKLMYTFVYAHIYKS